MQQPPPQLPLQQQGKGSRATQKRRAKKAREAGGGDGAVPPAQRPRLDEPATSATSASSCTSSSSASTAIAAAAPEGGAGRAAAAPEGGTGRAATAPEGGAGRSYHEWQMPMPERGNDMHEALEIALDEAEAITGRKYRYGALLVAGEDFIPLRSGSNKKPFMRDNIHAEASVLKGCERAAGKDMLIARLAPVRSSAGGSLLDSDDEDDFGGALGASRSGSALGAGRADGAGAALQPPAKRAKILNARPCANCERKMVQRGVRHCYFTLNAKSIGVLEYNP